MGIMGGPGRPGDASMNEEAAKDATSVTDRNPDRGDGGRDAGREPGRDAEDVRRGREEGLAALRILEATRLADVGAARGAAVADEAATRRRDRSPEPVPDWRPAPIPMPSTGPSIPEQPPATVRMPDVTPGAPTERFSTLDVLMESLETTRRGLELQGIAVNRNLRETETHLSQLRQVLPEALQTQSNLRELASAFEAMRIQQLAALNNAIGEVQSSLAVWRTNADSALTAFESSSRSLVSSQDSILTSIRTEAERELGRLERSVGTHLARMEGAQQELTAWQQGVQAALQSTMIDAHQRLEEAAVGNLRSLGNSLAQISDKLGSVDRERQVVGEQIDTLTQKLDAQNATVRIWEHRITTVETQSLPSGTFDGRVQTMENEVGRVSDYLLALDRHLNVVDARLDELMASHQQMQRDLRVMAWLMLGAMLVVVAVVLFVLLRA